MLLALNWWADNPHLASNEYTAPVPTEPDVRTAEGLAVVLIGGIGRARTWWPREIRGAAPITISAHGVGFADPPAAVVAPAPEPKPVLPTRAVVGTARWLVEAVGTADTSVPRIVGGRGVTVWTAYGLADTVAPIWGDGLATWGVASLGAGITTRPKPVAPVRRPWSGRITRAEQDTVALIAALYMGER